MDGDFVLLEHLDSVFQWVEEHYDTAGFLAAAVPNSWGDTYEALRLTTKEFNSGLFFARPNAEHFAKMLELGQSNQGMMLANSSPVCLFFEFADISPPLLLIPHTGKYLMDQQLLNEYFRLDGPHPWRVLPARFNRQFVRQTSELVTDIAAVHEKAFWHHGIEEIWQVWESGAAAVRVWDALRAQLVGLRKYTAEDVAQRLRTGQMCARKCPMARGPVVAGGTLA